MQKFLPIFPLNMVAFPGEQLKLHIFEPRYRELINECESTGKTFGLPVVYKSEIMEYGTEMELVRIYKKYETGEMDIEVRGIQVFRVLEVIEVVPEKLYSGAIVAMVNDIQDHHGKLLLEFTELTQKLFTLLDIEDDIRKRSLTMRSFSLGHYVGMDLIDEYEILKHPRETTRQKIIVEHIKKILPGVQQIAEIREKAKLNGHFRMVNPPEGL